MKKHIKDENDKGYKYILQCKKVFISLLKSFVRQSWVECIDEQDIINIDKSYVADDFKHKEADLVYKVRFKDSEVIFYVLIELQSSVDFRMPYRLLFYMMGIWNDNMKDAGKSSRRKSFKLPMVVPIVLYNGVSNWTACRSYKEMLAGYEEFGEYAVDFKYILIDVNRYKEEELISLSNMIGAVFLLDKDSKGKNTILEKIEKLFNTLNSLDDEEKEIFSVWAANLFGHKMKEEDKQELVKCLKESGGMNMVYGIERVMEKERKKERFEGKIEGKIETAKEAFRQGADIDFVEKITKLDRKLLQELKDENLN